MTGHTGFKGSWLALWLQRWARKSSGSPCRPRRSPACSRTPASPTAWYPLIGRHPRPARAPGRDRARIARRSCFTWPPRPLVRVSYAEPVETYATNVMGTVHVLEAVRRANSVRAVVIVTSDKCYENKEWLGAYRENEPMGGRDPYSSSKGCAELVTAAYRASFF